MATPHCCSSSSSLFPSRRIQAAELAADVVNSDPGLLAGHTLVIKPVDDGGIEWQGVRATCALARDGIHAIVGPAMSQVSIGVANICSTFQIPWASGVKATSDR